MTVMGKVASVRVEYDPSIDKPLREFLESREDVFIRATNTMDALRWTVVRDAKGRPYYQLRKKSQPEQDFVQLVEDELRRFDEDDLKAIIIQGERRCVDADHVSRRVEKWIERLNSFISDLQSWLTQRPAWTGDVRQMQQRDEELMRLWGVTPREVPEFLATSGDSWVRFAPNALFVAGANGRLDVITSRQRAYILLDSAPDDSPERCWQVAFPEARSILERFDQNAFFRLLDETL